MSDQKAWFDDDDLWRDLGPHMFTPKKLAAAVDEVAQIIDLLALQPGMTVLDMPCGWGRHSVEFAKRGFNVAAVDRTREYLERAKTAAREAGVESKIEFVNADMRTFARPQSFDVMISMFTSIGYCDTRDEEVAVVQNFQRNLKPGGRIIFEVAAKEAIARTYRKRWWDDDAGVLLLQDAEPIDGWTKMRNKWQIVRADGSRRELNFDLFLYSFGELKQLLVEGGFASIEPFADLKRTAYDNAAMRLVVTARKPD